MKSLHEGNGDAKLHSLRRLVVPLERAELEPGTPSPSLDEVGKLSPIWLRHRLQRSEHFDPAGRALLDESSATEVRQLDVRPPALERLRGALHEAEGGEAAHDRRDRARVLSHSVR